MNKAREKELRNLIRTIENNKNELERIKYDEEFYYDSIPENLQSSYRAEESERIIEELDDILDNFNDIIDSLNEVL